MGMRQGFYAAMTLILVVIPFGMRSGLLGSDPAWTDGAVDKGLAALLAKSGYTAIPVDLKNPTRPLVDVRLNDHPAVFLLDTATWQSTIDRRIVDALKLPTALHGQSPIASVGQSATKQEVSATVESLMIGAVKAPRCPLWVDEGGGGTDFTRQRKREFVGTIGDNILTPNRAIVDLSHAKLYLRGAALPGTSATAEIAAYFKSEGYVEVSCQRRGGKIPYVQCKVGKHELTLLLDTGSQNTMLDHAAAERIGIQGHELPKGSSFSSPPGSRPSAIGELPDALKLPGGVEIPEPNEMYIYDFSTLNRGLERLGLPRTDGLLGVNALRYFSAVIDYSPPEPRLFLIDANVRDSRLLTNEWVGEAAEVDGTSLPADDVHGYHLAIRKQSFHLQMGSGRRLDLKFDLMCGGADPKRFDLSAIGPGGMRAYQCIYDVTHERLRICMPLDVKPGEKVERPTEFKSKSGSPYAVLTFRRATAK